MAISDGILPELDHEMAGTRRELERVPDGKFSWKPHPKSMALGRLASHISEMVTWGTVTMTAPEFDMAPPGKPPFEALDLPTRAELLAHFDRAAPEFRAAIAAAGDAAWMMPWSLKKNGAVLMTMPRIGMVRSLILNHIIHHRAQLGVYLRLLDVPVPSIYGPSADEGSM